MIVIRRSTLKVITGSTVSDHLTERSDARYEETETVDTVNWRNGRVVLRLAVPYHPHRYRRGGRCMGIRIQPPDLEVPEDAPFLHDRLDRETPARVLTRVVASVEGPCVLSIDGPFGAGKSTFLRLWTQHLKNNGFPVARLNAWETDYSGDPFPALVEGIRAELESRDGGAVEHHLKTFRQAAGRVAVRATPALIRLATLGTIDVGPELASALGTLSEEAARDGIAQFQAQRKSLSAFREELCGLSETLSAAHDDRPLVIGIDELDRCRPSYAIEMLELAKHLFAVDHVVFALAVNRGELAHSVKVLYGQDFDAERYLRRFFDLDFRLPQPDRTAFIKQLMEATELNDHFERQAGLPLVNQQRPLFEGILQTFLKKDPLTLRDIAQAIHHLTLVFASTDTERVQYPILGAVALVLKFRVPHVYKLFRRGEKSDKDVVDALFAEPGMQELRSRREPQEWRAAATLEATVALAGLEIALQRGNLGHLRRLTDYSSPLTREYDSNNPNDDEHTQNYRMHFNHTLSNYLDSVRSPNSQGTIGFTQAAEQLELMDDSMLQI